MKKTFKKAVVIASIFFVQHLHAATITWDSVDYTSDLNSVFTLDIIGTDFLTNVDGGGVNISFDSNVLNVLSVSVDENLWDFGSGGINTGTIDNNVGTVNSIYVNAWSTVSGNFSVASVMFEAVGAGTTDLTLSEFAFNPWASGGSLIDHNYVAGSVSVSAVPVPAAVWLFGSGLIALSGFARKKS
ncbi:MAG: hypothetical protein DIZ80_17465 [endosymbiont of Galathealinum brachiosum]|uniref:PEP-CTERM sorting domain-containing protein n=1 Tax=endosymbiont of Galathealinum brachiosum TaxID=2200906 RepID=A0A370D872_9GAMM|nr:MAG: hypothetical protein DIZ80_17465 [endosymbiont of Galathealinum brachiosum]